MQNNDLFKMMVLSCVFLFTSFYIPIIDGRILCDNKAMDCPLDDIKFDNDVRFARRRNGLSDLRLRWPNAEICYIISGDFTTQEKEIIQNALRTGFEGTCLRFVDCQSCCRGDYVDISHNENGCWSGLGRQGGRQILNLGPTCVDRSTVLHEAMHAAGFVHQQSNPNRDDYIDVREENVGSNHLYNFDKFSPDEVTDYGLPYDVCSITHYDECAFSKNGQKTIVPKTPPNCHMGHVEQLSSIDRQKVNLMYNCRAFLQ